MVFGWCSALGVLILSPHCSFLPKPILISHELFLDYKMSVQLLVTNKSKNVFIKLKKEFFLFIQKECFQFIWLIKKIRGGNNVWKAYGVMKKQKCSSLHWPILHLFCVLFVQWSITVQSTKIIIPPKEMLLLLSTGTFLTNWHHLQKA